MTAIALLELDSVAVGIRVGDAMVKRARLATAHAGTVHPGRYLIWVTGDVASVEESVEAGREAAGATLLDEILLPDPHPGLVAAVHGERRPGAGEALGVVETSTSAAIVAAADRGLKGARVELQLLRLGDGLGGKGYGLFQGAVADVEAAVELAAAAVAGSHLVSTVVISQLHDEMRTSLDSAGRFAPLLRPGDAG